MVLNNLRSIWGGSLILFIISTFLDLKISDYATQATFHHWVDVTVVIFSAIGYWLPFPVIFVCIAIIFETYAAKLTDKKDQLGKINRFFFKIKDVFLIIYYVVFTVALSLFFFIWGTKDSANTGFGEGNNVSRVISGRGVLMSGKIICGILTIFIFSFVGIFFRRGAKQKQTFLNTNYAKTAFVILICLVYSFLQVWVVKHLMGRPAYFAVRYYEHNPYNGWSMFDWMTTPTEQGGLGWVYDPDHQTWVFDQADYKPWYIWNDPWANLKYWFQTRPVNDPNHDQWFNMNFPSGHTNAALCVVLFNLFYFSKNGAKTKTSKLQIASVAFSFLLVLIMMLEMVLGRFHWTSDVAWSGTIFVFFLWAAYRTVDRFGLYWANLYNKNYHDYKAPTTHFVDDTNKNKTSFICEEKTGTHLVFKFRWKNLEVRNRKIAKIRKSYNLDHRFKETKTNPKLEI